MMPPCLKLRTLRRLHAKRMAARSRRKRAERTSRLYWKAWEMYDAMPSGPVKRAALFALSFGGYDAEVYSQVIEAMKGGA